MCIGTGLCVLSGVDGSLCSLHDTCSLQSGDLNYLAAELTGKLGDVDLIAVLLDDVHHVDGDNNRNTELGKLGGEVKVTLKVRTVDDVEYSIGALADKVRFSLRLPQGCRARANRYREGR